MHKSFAVRIIKNESGCNPALTNSYDLPACLLDYAAMVEKFISLNGKLRLFETDKGKAKGKSAAGGKKGEEEEVSRGKLSPAANEEACFCVALFPFHGEGRRAKVERVSVSQA